MIMIYLGMNIVSGFMVVMLVSFVVADLMGK